MRSAGGAAGARHKGSKANPCSPLTESSALSAPLMQWQVGLHRLITEVHVQAVHDCRYNLALGPSRLRFGTFATSHGIGSGQNPAGAAQTLNQVGLSRSPGERNFVPEQSNSIYRSFMSEATWGTEIRPVGETGVTKRPGIDQRVIAGDDVGGEVTCSRTQSKAVTAESGGNEEPRQ